MRLLLDEIIWRIKRPLPWLNPHNLIELWRARHNILENYGEYRIGVQRKSRVRLDNAGCPIWYSGWLVDMPPSEGRKLYRILKRLYGL